MKPGNQLYKTAGVDTDATQAGLQKIIASIKETWPTSGSVGALQLDIGYFANVIDIGGIGLAICTDGVGSKSIIAQMMNRYDTIGIVPLDRIITGQDLVPGDVIIGLESSGIHSNGLTLARHVFFERAKLSIDHVFPELGVALGEELLRPTLIYVPEILEIISNIHTAKALINITGDGLLNLPRVDATVGFLIDDLPPVPPIFGLIQQCGAVTRGEMFEVYNMGVGFCVLVDEKDADATLSILRHHSRRAKAIGRVIADESKGVYLPRERLAGHDKEFRALILETSINPRIEQSLAALAGRHRHEFLLWFERGAQPI